MRVGTIEKQLGGVQIRQTLSYSVADKFQNL